jgi:hypothetical protein
MSVGITLEELLAWNEQSAAYWKTHLETNPELLELPCDIGGTATVQGFVRHIWGADLRWSQRLAGLPVADREKLAAGPLDVLFDPQPARRAGSNLERAVRSRFRLGASGAAHRLAEKDCRACPVPQPAPLGAVGHTGAQCRLPLEIQGRPLV